MVRKLTLKQAKGLKYGDTLYEIGEYNADGTARRWRVNGKPKTWKRSPHKVRIPIKHGLYSFGYIDELNLDAVSLREPKPVSRRKLRGMM